MKLREKAQKMKMEIPAVFMALKHKRTPWFVKAAAGITIAYALSPVDLIPDFIPVLGYLDDLIILPLMVTAVLRMIPEDILEECRQDAKDMWEGGRPKKWYFGIPVILIWVLIFVWIWKFVVK